MASKDIETFSLWARCELQQQVELRAACYGVSRAGDAAALDASAWEVCGRTLSSREHAQRASLVAQVQARGHAAVMEEATYTWFNRLVALRFMDANGYLECGASWFSTPGQAGFRPEVLTRAQELNLPGLDEAVVDNHRRADDEEGLYRYLFDLQCSALSHALPRMFSPLEDWTQLLCPANLLRETGVPSRMAQDIPEEDWRREVEIVGWMYQFYNEGSKAEVYARLKKGRKVEKVDIAPATQLFTPDWIVRYLVQNSLGRLWMNLHPQSQLAEQMEYYRAPVQKPAACLRVDSPEELKICDPACGSGHMLTYAFDLLYAIYEEEGYASADIPALILRHNLYGIDLDQRAGDLAYFALMMKARARDRRFLRRGVQPHICVLHNVHLSDEELAAFGAGALSLSPGLLRAFEEADNFGSLIRPDLAALDALRRCVEQPTVSDALMQQKTQRKLMRVLTQAEYLSPRYHVVVANPPYMGIRNMNVRLSAWARENYPDSKSDLFSMFMEQGMTLARPDAFCAMITMHGWMFLSGLENLRKRILSEKTIISLAHLGTRAFDQIAGEVVATCAYVLSNAHEHGYEGDFLRLVDEPSGDQKRILCQQALSAGQHACLYRAAAGDFDAIDGSPIAYWISPKALRVFAANRSLGEVVDARQGLASSDNNRFLRLWYEVARPRFAPGMGSAEAALQSGCKWFPHNKGGSYRKWYGNQDYVINWEDGGREILNYAAELYGSASRTIKSISRYFQPSVSWSRISGNSVAFRYYPEGFVFDAAGPAAFAGDGVWLNQLLACCNTAYVSEMTKVISSTITFEVGGFNKLPHAERFWSEAVAARAARLVELAREDWDSYETSWNFTTLPLLRAEHRRTTLAETYAALRAHWRKMTEEMAQLEQENNCDFNELYELGDEFPSAVPPEQITLTCNPAYRYGADKSPQEQEALLRADTVKELLSYAVGCFFGRYSLTTPGLIFAGGEWDDSRYGELRPDADNILPICDEEYFPDDLCGRLVDFVRLVFGAEALEENLAFIAESLGGKGSARDIIRNYVLKDFYADHCRLYGKRPIYWQADSGKKAGFRALLYLHRYDQDTLARMRTDYVFRQQERYRAAQADVQQRLESAKGRTRVTLSATLKKLQDQEAELSAFEQHLHHLANQRIALDLDEGVAANYARFSPLLTKIR